MNSLRTLARLPQHERALFFRALLVVTAFRVGLWVLPFQRLQRMAISGRPPVAKSDDLPISRMVWAVRAASKRIPAASCLIQSLALQYLLTSAGHHSQVRIGVAKEPKATFHAHAWVEYEGEPLLSTTAEVERYARVLAVEDKAA